MTIIASYNIYGCKVLLADTLITSQQRNESKPTLPTLGKIDSTRVDSDFYIAGNLQKIQILSDYCAVAYAGKVSLAHQFITTLSDILKERTLLISDIENTYKDIDGNTELAIIYLYNTDNEEIISGGLNCVNALSDVLGEVTYRGSGEQAITDYIEWLDGQAYISPPSDDEVVAQAVSITIQQIAQLQMAEIKSENMPESIKDCFGSGYEIVTFYDGKFNRIDLTYAFIELSYNKETKNVEINHPYLILSQYITNDFLIHDRYQQNNYDCDVDSNLVEYQYDQIITQSLLNLNEDIPAIIPPDKINNLNFCCFIFHDNFKHGTTMWQSAIIRSDTPPINIIKYHEGNLYYVDYSEQAEKQLIGFVSKNYL
ncbi:hypothetical protein ACRZK7_005049 [Klebsiella oxytoca]|uniref:Uncharacterized protein n=1 Tax=Klebsiella oxytoca TaxID=571 RepID=A0AAP2BF49_KLEOX|nr:hypothetical protein [Klebsiella oxytoca]EJB5615130.1 hypothetical protein [Klebsiella oxytoca]EJZ8383603.1 hypothetical protein [Klebsiella oxytoca]EKW7109075.1 hypothetical protein [Klebsiella oxytoca]ELN5374040.1 hypothetical protein [Klebsiella oxytoca]ELV3607553.1 hypothetical protein [Klebsiella oxytoca]